MSYEEIPLKVHVDEGRGGVGGGAAAGLQPMEVSRSSKAASPPGPPSAMATPPMGRRPSEPFKKWFPWLVPTIFLVDVVLFFITMYINNCHKHTAYKCVLPGLGRFSFQPLKQNPLLGASSATLVKMGALDMTKVVHQHQRWRLLTCMWLHAGLVHLLANMFCLLFIGLQLEKEFGFVKVGLVYLISGIGGSLLSGLFVQSSISVGASGALFGLLGAMLSELITNWTIYANKFAAMSTLIIIIVINLAIGILPHVDNFAHIGGFVSGFFLGFVILIRPQYAYISQKDSARRYQTGRSKSRHNACQYTLLAVAVIVLIILFTLGTVLVFRGVNGNDHCSWCHYLSCVPTSKWSCKSGGTASCEIIQSANQLNVTCEGNGKNGLYPLSNTNSTQYTYDLCVQLCS